MAKKSQEKVPANAMDYPEHERTYESFLKFSIWTTAGCVALLIAMAFGFFGGGGLIGGTLAFIILMVICFFVL
ncbi:MAG: aa3-type cytochrome c oxidase subunit IV [Pseudomonadota bacterium]